MNIVEPYSRLIHFNEFGDQVEFTKQTGVGLLRKIEWNARISHGSEDAQTPDSWERFIKFVVMGKGDWSVVEHATATVDTLVDRGITHEWVRHRLFSFTQSSTRFINYAKKVLPSFIKPTLPDSVPPLYWNGAIAELEKHYSQLIAWGCTPQIARSLFPNALASRISTTGNLRNWRHFFIMRTTKEAHPQMRQVVIPLLEEFKSKIPLLYDDIIPLSRQIDNMRLPR